MIEYIKGSIAELTPTAVVIDINGVGYIMQISLQTYTSFNGQKEVKAFVYENIREDAHTLFGFATKEERELFLLLISVSGIGGNTARVILSTINSLELQEAIATSNVNVLKNVKGIGLKTAQRIIVDLRDKVGNINSDAASFEEIKISSSRETEASQALQMLGFVNAAVTKVVTAVVKENANLTVEEIIKAALKRL